VADWSPDKRTARNTGAEAKHHKRGRPFGRAFLPGGLFYIALTGWGGANGAAARPRTGGTNDEPID
jgi:hypothetical protein